MTPTDDQINIVLATLRGWSDIVFVIQGRRPGKTVLMGVPPGGKSRIRVPDYCTDRNRLPDVWSVVLLDFKSYLEHLTRISCGTVIAPGYPQRNPLSWWEDTAPMSPRLHAEAALRALGEWPPEWETE